MTQTELLRELAVEYFNATWAIIDQPDRTPDQERQMLLLACTSRQLWGEVGGPVEIVTGDWQVAHVAALVGQSDLSLAFASAAYEQASRSDVPDWLMASACEGLARAHAAAGHVTEREAWIAKAREHLKHVDDDEDRELVDSQIASIPVD